MHLPGHCRNCSLMHKWPGAILCDPNDSAAAVETSVSDACVRGVTHWELQDNDPFVAATRLVPARLAWAGFLIVTMQSDIMLKREAKGENQSMPPHPVQ